MYEYLTSDEQKLLLSFVNYTKANELEGLSQSDLFEVSRENSIPAALRRAHFDKTLKSLLNNLVLISYRSGDSRELRIHENFLDEAFQLYNEAQTPSEQIESPDEIPAAGRFVAVNHNSLEFREALEGLEKLEKRIKDSNEFSASPEERIVLSKEVDDLRTALSGPVVRSQAVWTAIKNFGVIHYLTEHGSDAMLNALALEVTNHVLKLFGWS